MEEDAHAVGGEAAEAAGGVFESLDLAVEAFGDRVGDAVGK